VPQQVITRPGSDDKRLTREAMRGIMPEPVRRSVQKILPTPLFHRALRETAATTVEELLTDSRSAAAGYVDSGRLRREYDEYLAGKRLAAEFWWALTLEMWLRRHEESGRTLVPRRHPPTSGA
jgi:asparagine synthetase B (glutamine-hydrolysing)